MPALYWPFTEYSEICLRGNGVGCDGGSCLCPCHGEYAPNFQSNEEVAEWHK